MARLNKRTFNKLELKRGTRPVLHHVGRNSGRAYQTPMDAHLIDGGFIFIPMYGPDSDWVRNVLHSGGATVAIRGDEYPLSNPRLIPREQAIAVLPEATKMPPAKLHINTFLRMDITG